MRHQNRDPGPLSRDQLRLKLAGIGCLEALRARGGSRPRLDTLFVITPDCFVHSKFLHLHETKPVELS